MRSRASSGLLVAALVAALTPLTALAQSPGGSVGGTVVDSNGGPIPGASVTARNQGTSATRQTVSGAGGQFSFPSLPVGKYQFTAELSGFSPAKLNDVAVTIGGDLTLKLNLSLAGVAESLTVVSQAPIVETTRTQSSSVVDEASVTNLPTNGRNFIDFVLTTPGVVKDVRAGDISFAGQRGTLNSLVVDGADNNNTFFGQALGRTGSGRAPYQFSQDAVQEFQVNRNAYSAEYGRAGGAVINVVTKSGTNDFHGSLFFFKRDKSIRANDYIDEINNRVKAPYKFDQFGASVGGPIVRDRVFFFANYDGQRNTIPNTVVLGVPQGGYPTDAASQAGLAKVQALASSWERAQNQDVFLAKVDAELGGGSRLSLRYNRQDFTGQNFENGGITNAFEHTGDSLVKTDTVTASLSTSLSPRFFNELRGQFAKDSEPGLSNSGNPEATIRQGGTTILTAGRNNFSPRETTINRYQIADTATLLFDKHTLKLGFDLNRDLILNFFPGFFAGSYTFNTLAAFNAGKADTYQQNFAGVGTSGATTNPDLSEIAAFVQDEFRPASNLTLNVGVRYDRQGIHQPTVQNPDPQLLAAGIDTSVIKEDGNNIAARLGIAWTPKNNDKMVVRAGYGMFYGRTPAIMIGTAHSNNGINVLSYTLSGSAIPASLVYPNTLASAPTAGATKPSIFFFDKDYQSPIVHQASAGIEQGLTEDFAVALSYLYVRGQHLSRSIDVNVGAYSAATIQDDQGNTLPYRLYSNTRPFANFARVIDFQSTGDSNYNGLTIELIKRYSHHWQGRLSYTYSKVLDTKPDSTAVVPGNAGDDIKYAQDPLFLDDDYGPGENDATHRFVVSGVWNLDYFKGDDFLSKWVLGGWSISGIFSYTTGQPFTANIGTFDLNNDGNRNNDRAPGLGRNTFRLPSQITLDPRLTKEFDFGAVRFQLIAEAFNLLNRSNVSNVRTQLYSVVGGRLVTQTSTFGTPSVSSGPRTIQLAAKLLF